MSNRVLSVHQEHELLLKLEQAGLSESGAQAVIGSKGNTLAQKLIGLIREAREAEERKWFSFTTTGRSIQEQMKLYSAIVNELVEGDDARVLVIRGTAGRKLSFLLDADAALDLLWRPADQPISPKKERGEFILDPWDLVDAAVAYKETTGRWPVLSYWLRTGECSSFGSSVCVEFRPNRVHVADPQWRTANPRGVISAIARESA